MKPLFYILLFFIGISCSTKETEPEPNAIPEQQEIVYVDTSGLTGELTVFTKYYNALNQIHKTPSGASVSLYASYEDLQNGLSLYDVISTNDTVYFGFINYGNYYVKSDLYIDTTYYYAEVALQIRPKREEILTITMY